MKTANKIAITALLLLSKLCPNCQYSGECFSCDIRLIFFPPSLNCTKKTQTSCCCRGDENDVSK